MGKRKLPFGYIMENGDIKPEPQAQNCVRWIFTAYSTGASLNEITAKLNKNQKIQYDKDKPWNKNMVDRILQDQRYAGDPLYPEIIPPKLFEDVQSQRAERTWVPRQSKASIILRDYCKGKPIRKTEEMTLSLLNRLIADPSLIQSPSPNRAEQIELFRIRKNLEEAMAHPAPDEDLIAQLILKQAELECAMLGDEEYETERLRRLFSSMEPITELTAGLLRQSVASISVEIKKVSVTLKNNQVIEAGDLS